MGKFSDDLIQRSQEQLRVGRQLLKKSEELLLRYRPEPRAFPKINAKSGIGENLKKLCKECGWTPYQLHKQTGLDKKLVLGHINGGKGCSLQNRKIYANVFTKELGRKIPNDLEL
jgi:hypothetical protein